VAVDLHFYFPIPPCPLELIVNEVMHYYHVEPPASEPTSSVAGSVVSSDFMSVDSNRGSNSALSSANGSPRGLSPKTSGKQGAVAPSDQSSSMPIDNLDGHAPIIGGNAEAAGSALGDITSLHDSLSCG
jgi:hypothetical protein